MLYKEIHAPQRELYGCLKPVEWEVTITVHYTVITDLSLLCLTILYRFVEGVFPDSSFDHTAINFSVQFLYVGY